MIRGKGNWHGWEEEEEHSQSRVAMKRNEMRGAERKGKKKKELIRMKREAEPRNRAIKALLLASARAAREAHCFGFETSVRSERPTRSHLLTEKIHASMQRWIRNGTPPRIHKRLSSGEWRRCFGEICGLFEKKFLSLLWDKLQPRSLWWISLSDSSFSSFSSSIRCTYSGIIK